MNLWLALGLIAVILLGNLFALSLGIVAKRADRIAGQWRHDS